MNMAMAGLQLPADWFCSRSPWPSPSSHRSLRFSLRPPVVSQQEQQQEQPNRSTKLVTFLGKGGSGKTIGSLLAAHYYAENGMRTCLVLQSQDPSADYLLGCKIGNTPTALSEGALDVLRLESTKLLLDPLAQLKKADTKLNFSQGALDEVVGEELSVLPGMDALLGLGAMERFIGFAGDILKNRKGKTYDVVVYDGLSSEETLRLLGAAEKSRWYLQRAKDLAEKTDTGRVTSPSVMRLLEASVMQDTGSDASGRSIAELWDGADKVLERISDTFRDPKRFSCYLVMDPNDKLSVNAALRYWGCAMQAGVRVTGGFFAGTFKKIDTLEEKFSPLMLSNLPLLSLETDVDWSAVVSTMNTDTTLLLGKDNCHDIPAPVEFNMKEQKVSLFLPGFDKKEIKLSQWRGGSALLIEAGDQRRVITLPINLRGKVAAAKFEDKSLTITMKTK